MTELIKRATVTIPGSGQHMTIWIGHWCPHSWRSTPLHQVPAAAVKVSLRSLIISGFHGLLLTAKPLVVVEVPEGHGQGSACGACQPQEPSERGARPAARPSDRCQTLFTTPLK